MKRKLQLREARHKENSRLIGMEAREIARLSGRGKFNLLRTVKRVGKMALQKGLSLGGEAVGAAVGQPGIGKSAGAWLGGRLSRLVGFGKYEVLQNSLVHSNPIPTFQGAKDGEDGIIICHREFITDVVGSVNFSVAEYPINPGLASGFPWLSNVSSCFTEYEIIGACYEYRPTSGNIAAASPALGTVMMSTNYNVHEPAFTDKVQMTSAQYSMTGVPCSEILHPIECKPNSNINNRYLLRHAGVEGDLGLYDFGMFQIATEGMQSAYTVGELWVTYQVRLSRPVIEVGLMAIDMMECVFDGTILRLSADNTNIRAASTLGSSLRQFVPLKPDGTPAGAMTVEDAIVMPPKTGDYMVVVISEYLGGYPAATTQGISLIANASTAITAMDWGGSITYIADLTSTGDNTDVSIRLIHMDGSTYTSKSTLDMSQRAIVINPPATAPAAGTTYVFIVKLPTGIGVSPYTALSRSLESLVAIKVRECMGKFIEQQRLERSYDKVTDFPKISKR